MVGWSCDLCRLALQQNRFNQLQVFFRVDAYCVVVGGFDVEGDVVFEEA